MRHYDEATLLAFLEGMTPIEAGIGDHIESCAACSNELERHRSLHVTLGDARIWRELPPVAETAVEEMTAFAERVADEDQRAAVACDQLLTGPLAWWAHRFTALLSHDLNAGLARQLMARARARLERAPREALAIIRMGVSVGEQLDPGQYPAHYVDDLYAQALRDYAFVLWFTGRFHDAREVAERSAVLFASVPLSDCENARLSLVRAMILRNLGEDAEALRLCREAGATFSRLGERTRFVRACMTEGLILYCRAEVRAALETWLSIENDPTLTEIDAMRLQHNIALCRADLGEPELAIEPLRICDAKFVSWNMPTVAAHSRGVLGRVLVAMGQAREALPLLRDAMREFAEQDVNYDFSLVAMEYAEALIALGRTAEVPAVCRAVIARLAATGVAAHAIPALSYLREVESGSAPATAVKSVAKTWRELRDQGPLLFAPPPDGERR